MWSNFYDLITQLGKQECSDVDGFELTKDITPYIHAFAKVLTFVWQYSVIFTQQNLEKLNDLTTKYFQSASNHREMESLK